MLMTLHATIHGSLVMRVHVSMLFLECPIEYSALEAGFGKKALDKRSVTDISMFKLFRDGTCELQLVGLEI